MVSNYPYKISANLKYDTNFVYFINITTVFLTSNNRNIRSHGSSYFESVTLRNPERIIFNFSDHQLTEHESF